MEATPGSAIPASGTATYKGYTSGIYVNGNKSFLTVANMTANADFAARSVQFATNNSNMTNVISNASSANPDLDLSGTLSYAKGKNGLSGAIKSANGMTGNAKGQFYGPKAQEIGGTFLATGTGNQGYMGAFGGKR